MDNAALLKLTQWLSPAYPIGAFSYSHGLEWAIDAGDIHDAETLQVWLSDLLKYGTGRNDAILLAAAYKADKTTIRDIAELASALANSRERQLETTAQGKAFARTTRDIWPGDLPDMPYPVAIGWAAKSHAIALAQTLPMYLHAFTANLISAGVRFVPLGQTAGQRLLATLTETIEHTAKDALAANLDDLGSACFRGDMAAMHHETMKVRIFRT